MRLKLQWCLILTFLLWLTGCRHDPYAHLYDKTAQAKPHEPLLIEPRVSVGKIKSGMTTQQVVAAIGRPDRRSEFILEYLRFGFAVTANRDGLVRTIQGGASCDLDSPLIKMFAGRTKEGIGMGSTREEIIKAFGQPSREEGGEIVYSKLGLRFLLADDKVHHMTITFPK